MYAYVVLGVLFFDQLTKWIVRSYLKNAVSLFPTFSITLVSNTGAGFGILQHQRVILSLIAFLVILWLTYTVQNETLISTIVGYGMVAGGALGNLIDRLLMGSVTDFLSFTFFPAFNVADSAISLGVVVLLISLWKEH